MRVRSRRVDALERAPPDALAGPASPGSGTNHALYSQLKGRDLNFPGRPHPGCTCKRCLKVRVRVRSRRVDALERAPPDTLAGPASPGSGPNHALYYPLKGSDLFFGQAPPCCVSQAVPRGGVRVRSRGVDALERAPPDALAGPASPGIGPNHALLSQAELQGPFIRKAPPCCTCKRCLEVRVRDQQSRVDAWSGRPQTLSLVRHRPPAADPKMLYTIRAEGQGPVFRAGPTLAARASGASRCECASAVEG